MSMMDTVIPFALLCFTSLFTITSPLSTMPVFLTMTQSLDEKERRAVAIRATLVACCALLLFVLAGQFLFKFFGISTNGFRIVGGIIIYYGHDLHFLRIHREYELDGQKEKLEESEKWKEQELYIMRQADMNYYPSMIEEQAIHEIDSKIPVKAITAYVYEKFMDVVYEPEKREGILFVGGFGHAPNLDAVQWFLDKIYPDVYKNIKADFYIVGSKAPDEITHITTEGVIVKGFVSEEELQQLYNSCKLVVVPLRYGAGVKGKVVEALYYGIPIVTTSVGAEGIKGIEDIAVVEDQEQKLIDAICKVYQNDEKLIEMSEKSQLYVREKFSTDAVWDIVKEDFE